jgi:hypothetical protein
VAAGCGLLDEELLLLELDDDELEEEELEDELLELEDELDEELLLLELDDEEEEEEELEALVAGSVIRATPSPLAGGLKRRASTAVAPPFRKKSCTE